ncbi:hypothetical protein AB0L40_12945 [Patulibacter sp. NPDC049589]|uniref:hypothetical protein n=1 Tax=Patulibacter sp. NPDC049589 TaxID=3154731 RepID=UPI003421CBF0
MLLRLAIMVALPQPLMSYTDANVYVRAAQEYLFRPLEGRTAGYPLFLRLSHDVSGSPTFPVVLQHLLSLVGGLLLYATALAVRVPRAVAAVAAAVWLLSIDWLWLEHQLLTETLASALAMAALAALVLVPIRQRENQWVTAALVVLLGVGVGILAMSAGFVRPALFPVLPGVGLAALLLMRVSLKMRVLTSTALVLTCLVMLLGYLHEQEKKTGFYGLVGSPPAQDLGGYPGVAPFAQCSKFKVPRGTRSLCENTPADSRPGSDYYYWDGSSPGRKLLAAHPNLNASIKLWATRAAAAQSGDVWGTQVTAFQRLFGFGGLVRPVTDQGTQILNLKGADAGPAAVAVDAINAYYGPGSAPNKPARAPWGALTALQPITRPSGLVLVLFGLVLLAGVAFGRGIGRRAAIAFGAAGWVPALYATYAGGLFNWRYVVPSVPVIALAAAAAVAALLARRGTAGSERTRRMAADAAPVGSGGW